MSNWSTVFNVSVHYCLFALLLVLRILCCVSLLFSISGVDDDDDENKCVCVGASNLFV